jgi:hypothetical protein
MGFAGGIATIYDGATCPSTQTLLHNILLSRHWIVCEVKNILVITLTCCRCEINEDSVP